MTIVLNKEIGKMIKDFRIKNNITATIVANEIGKTNAYISKLEKGDFKSIDFATLQLILNAITDIENDKNKLLSEIQESGDKLSFTQIVVNKISEIEAFQKDYDVLILTMSDNLAITEKVLEETKENAKDQLTIYKKELMDLIEQITL